MERYIDEMNKYAELMDLVSKQQVNTVKNNYADTKFDDGDYYKRYVRGEKYADQTDTRVYKDKELDQLEDAGYMLKSQEIVVDIDNLKGDIVVKILKEFNINTKIVRTNRGFHLYFKKPDNYNINWPKNTVCALGFKIELLTQKTNPSGITIKQNGQVRRVKNSEKTEDLPFIFNLCHYGKYVDCLGLEEGDGRNNALFQMKQRLQENPDSQKILRFINQNIFTEPLEEKELQTIINGKLRKDNVDYRTLY